MEWRHLNKSLVKIFKNAQAHIKSKPRKRILAIPEMNRQGNGSKPFCLNAPLEEGYYYSFTHHLPGNGGTLNEAVSAIPEIGSSCMLSPQGIPCILAQGPDPHQSEASCKLGFPIRAMYVMHCLQPLEREGGTSIRACQITLHHSLHNTQALIVRHQLWNMCYMNQNHASAPIWGSSNLAHHAACIHREVMMSCVREEMLCAIALGEVCDGYRHAFFTTPERHEEEVAKFRIRCIIVLENMPVILSEGPVTLLSTYNQLLGGHVTFEPTNLILTLLASVGRSDLVDRFILQRCLVLPLPAHNVFMEDECFDALNHVPETVLASCMRGAVVHTGRGKSTQCEWRAAIVQRFMRDHVERMMLAFCLGRRCHDSLVRTLPDEIVCTICKMAWRDVERRVRKRMEDGIK